MITVNAKIFNLDNTLYRSKMSKAGLISFCISVYIIVNFLLLVLLAKIGTYVIFQYKILQILLFLIGLGFFATPLTSALAVVFGIIGKAVIYNSAGIKKGKNFAQTGFVLGLIIFILCLIIIFLGNMIYTFIQQNRWWLQIVGEIAKMLPHILMGLKS